MTWKQHTLEGDSTVTEKEKPRLPVKWVVNWYLGNYIESPNNSLRNEDVNRLEWVNTVRQELGAIEKELGDTMLTHKEFLNLVKQRGIHGKYYHYKKYENNCRICKALGLK